MAERGDKVLSVTMIFIDKNNASRTVNETASYEFVSSFVLSLIDSHENPTGYDNYEIESVSTANNYATLIFREK